jgi:transcriptional antiterminator
VNILFQKDDFKRNRIFAYEEYLNLIKEDAKITRKDLADQLGVTTKTIARDIEKLKKWTKLTSIDIPDSVMSIGIGAFSNCDSMNTMYYSGTQEQVENISSRNNKALNT